MISPNPMCPQAANISTYFAKNRVLVVCLVVCM